MLKRKNPFTLPLAEGEIIKKRAAILNRLCALDEGFYAVPVTDVREETLVKMLYLYDDLFLDGYIKKHYDTLDVTLSSRLISSAGKFICTKGRFGRISHAEIRMSSDFLFRLDKGPFELNGLFAATPQEAFLVVFEHELCHAIEMSLYGKTGHSDRFLALANRLFGHTATRHKLPTRKQEALDNGLSVGMRAMFIYQRQEYQGTVTYIGKTATVMVQDSSGNYRDHRSRRYSKYRVPISRLRPLP